MRTIARILAPLLVLAGFLAGAPTEAADTPANVHDGRAGDVTAGWVRLACATNGTGVKCALRFPEGARTVTVEHRIGGKVLGVEQTFPYRAEHRPTPAPARRASGTAAGVRLACTGAGQRIDCTITYPARVRDLNVTTYVRGWNYGGLRAEGLVL